jgi:hypothetical protein
VIALARPGSSTGLSECCWHAVELRLSKLFFFHSSLDLPVFQDPVNAVMRQAMNVKVLVEGREVQVSYADLALSSQEKVIAAVFPVDFPVGGETEFQIQGDLDVNRGGITLRRCGWAK